MKIILETTEQDDTTLQALSDAAMVGRGKEKQPDLEEFTAALLRADMDTRNLSAKHALRNELKSAIDQADDAKLAAIAQAMEPTK